MALSLAALASSCVDKEMEEYTLTKEDLGITPELEEQFEYVNQYDALKSYLKNQNSTPGNGFMLGIAVSGNVYADGGDEYLMAAQNFQMVTYGNEMKYASVVNAKGQYNFDMVGKLVAKAENAGHVIIGHTLCWHEQSQPDYLNSLLKDVALQEVEIPGEGGETPEVTTKFVEQFKRTFDSWNHYVMGSIPQELEEDGVKFIRMGHKCTQIDESKPNAKDGWEIDPDPQATGNVNMQTGCGAAFKEGDKIQAKIKARANQVGSFDFVLQWGWGEGESVKKSVSIKEANKWEEYTLDFGAATATIQHDVTIQKWGAPEGFRFDIEYIILGTEVNVDANAIEVPGIAVNGITNSDFESDDLSSFPVGQVSQATDKTKAEIVTIDGNKVLKVTSLPSLTMAETGGDKDNNDPCGWTSQVAFYTQDHVFKTGDTYTLKFKYKADKAQKIPTQSHGKGIDYLHWQAAGDIEFTTEWKTFEKKVTVPADAKDKMQSVVLNLNEGSMESNVFYFDDVELMYEMPVEGKTVVYCDLSKEGDDKLVTAWGDGQHDQGSAIIEEGSNKVFKVTNTATTDNWRAQLGYDLTANGIKIDKDQEVHVYFRMKADNPVTLEGDNMLQEHVNSTWENCGPFEKIEVTTDWKWYHLKTKTKSANSTRFLISFGKYDLTGLYFDDFILTVPNIKTRPLSDEEKRDTLLWELNRYVDEMFKATDYKVYVWDLLNEPMKWDGKFQSESDYSEEDQKNKFFWHTYLGDSFGADLAKIAREKYKGDKDLLLFINDYSLEVFDSKLEGLIKAINDWDAILKAEGVKEIDGIASQCHISYKENPEELEKLKKGYTNALTKMSATGKLVRISEFDMGYTDANGNDLKTGDLTLEQHKNMADFTQWCMEEYFKVVPANQQFGFTFWCPKDAPENSGWRKGEPVGIWTQTGKRKPVYEGIVNALQNN